MTGREMFALFMPCYSLNLWWSLFGSHKSQSCNDVRSLFDRQSYLAWSKRYVQLYSTDDVAMMLYRSRSESEGDLVDPPRGSLFLSLWLALFGIVGSLPVLRSILCTYSSICPRKLSYIIIILYKRQTTLHQPKSEHEPPM
ncbi:hypothetical protein ASPWEDRAFT_35225 [Aspergillus wentii DTO 134E9]|uniref:Uncharacterized protein n=1 Tax=Aspergillus wentii DTO 134E9 TaxID=1073089 RepID=A0A1L9S389_ASPWE|nr:uncharacterized protein ASPWEDRAFT_35225 [Aspergillus wentii DTO 134E9]OJJ41634.1 hypothetical protein ASPWEDRAFT_35225 [Aspergillus wentii DTO 134E9]